MHSRTLLVSPVNSLLRLGVSPATSTPQVFIARGFEAFFPCAGTLGCAVCLAPQLLLPVYPHAMWDCQHHLACPVLQLLACCLSFLLWLPVSAPPTGLDECFFFISSVSDFHTVGFSVSSGCFLFLNCCCPSFDCVRRHSVSVYLTPPSWPEAPMFYLFNTLMNPIYTNVLYFRTH